MGRPKNFSRDGVLEKALPVFWRHGFAATSLQDLEQATGVNKSGLYSEFKDKEDLFLASLLHYLDSVGEEAASPHHLGWDNIERFFKLTCKRADAQRGCFAVNSMREFAVLPREAQGLVADGRAAMRQFFVANIQAEHTKLDPIVLADMVLTFFSGLCIEQNLKASKASTLRKIDNWMQVIRHL